MDHSQPLRAKSGKLKPGRGLDGRTLVGHSRLVLAAATALFGDAAQPTRFARSWLRFFGLSDDDIGWFIKHLRFACAAHDPGKANDGMQGVLASAPDITQVIRHEILSALFLADTEVIAWLREAGLDEFVTLAAILSHHVKAGPQAVETPVAGDGGVVRLCLSHPDFERIRSMIGEEAAARRPMPITLPGRMKKDEINRRGSALKDLLERLSRVPDLGGRRGRLLSAVRAALIVADAAGSAVLRVPGEEDAEARLAAWIGDCFSMPLRGDEVWNQVVRQRVDDLRARGRWNDTNGHEFNGIRGFTQFQCDVAGMGPRVLLTAPCGLGKTLAAWNWIKVQLDQFPDKSRVLFLYPTRATATEGFRDYVSWAPEDDAGLLSGTANYELQDMFETPDLGADPRTGRDYRSDPRLFALGHWKKRIFSATADQFFPFLTYSYGPICLMPLLAEAVVVVDEVHSFDRSMFATLKRFLKAFPSVPVLCMTATLTTGRREDLTDGSRLGDGTLKPYPETPPADLDRIAKTPRYRVEWIERDSAERLVRAELHDRKRILWVSNRVRDCQETFERFDDEADDGYLGPGGVSTYCYHSRFKLDHRKERHQDLIRAFQKAAYETAPSQGILGCTTQVCEMSLDLDAQILVTELAPIAALIQRMGRCNRGANLNTRTLGRVYVIRAEAGKEKPYVKEELEAAKRFVDRIVGGEISHHELEEAYKACDTSPVEPSKLCPFLDSGPFAEAGEPWRDSDEFTVPCVLDDDVRRVQDILSERRPENRVIDGLIVPVPRRFANERKPTEHFPRWLSVALGHAYDKRIGFDERKVLPPAEETP